MSLKRLKRDMDSLFKKLLDTVENGSIPDLQEIKDFTKMASRLQNYASDEWALEAEDFAHLSKQLIAAVKSKDIQEIYSLITALDDAKNYCHRSFKD